MAVTVVWPYPFRDFDGARLAIDQLGSSAPVSVHDITALVNPATVAAYQRTSDDPRRLIWTSWRDWSEVIEASASRGAVVISGLAPSSPRAVRALWVLARAGVPTVGLLLGGVPGLRRSLSGRGETWRRLLGPLFHLLKRRLVRRLAPTAVLLGGCWSSRALRRAWGHRSAGLLGRSFDADRAVGPSSKSLNEPAVYVDTGYPAMPQDYAFLGKPITEKPNHWHDRLEQFMLSTDRVIGDRTIVAVHPKHRSDLVSSHFMGRSCVADRTPLLAANAALLLTINSTAVSFAILNSRPIALTTSRMREQDDHFRSVTATFAFETGARVFNIDQDYTDDEIRAALTIDEAKYARYRRKYLTTRTDDKRNYQILLEEVIWPYAEMFRAEQERTGVGPDGALSRRSRKRIIRQLQRRIRERNEVTDLLREAKEMKKIEDAEWRAWRREDRRAQRERRRAARS